MVGRSISRRAAVGGIAATASLGAVDLATARPVFRRGGHPTGAGGGGSSVAGRSVTIVNSAGTDSPTDVPIIVPQGFVEGEVPSGSIAVPTIGGVPVAYQADARVYDGAGALMFAVFRIVHSSAITAGGTIQPDFVVQSGTYDNSSAITTAAVTSASDLSVSLTNVHNAMAAPDQLKQVAVTIGGGQVTGAKVWRRFGTGAATYAITNGGGTGGQISLDTLGNVTVDNPGSGYTFLGTGSFNISLNTVIAAINSGGNHANGVAIEQYAKGPVCDAWRVMTTVAGAPHLHVTFYVERWKKADGTFLDFRRTARVGTGLIDTVNPMYIYTYDMDFKDGSTVIVGANGGDARYQTVANFIGASCMALDLQGYPYWASANDAAWKAIYHQRTPTECDYFRKSELALTWNKAVTPTRPVPTTPSGFDLNTGDAGIGQLSTYQPFGNAGVRSPLGAAGGGNQESTMWEGDNLYWMNLYKGLTAAAKTWRNNCRMAALHAMSFPQLGGGTFEPTTLYIPNVIPASKQVFTGMTPTRETMQPGSGVPGNSVPNTFDTTKGYAHPIIGGGLLSWTSAAGGTYHLTCTTYGSYLQEAEQWILDALMYSSSTPAIARNPASVRQATVGTTTYYGLFAAQVVGTERDMAWVENAAAKYAAIAPVTWADGTRNVERDHVEFTVSQQYTYMLDLISFIGSVKFGSGGATTTKSFDFTDSGVSPEMLGKTSATAEEMVPFMVAYDVMCCSHNSRLNRGKPLGTTLRNWMLYRKGSVVRIWRGPGSHFMSDSYRMKVLAGRQPDAPVTPLFTGFDVTNPTVCGYSRPPGGTISFMKFDGSDVFTITDSAGTPMVLYVYGTTLPADGTRIMLTNTDIDSGGDTVSGSFVPSGYDKTVWYYAKWLTGTTGQLCTDAALTNPVASIETKTRVNYWPLFSNLPADNSGVGTQHNSTNRDQNGILGVRLACMNIMKACGLDEGGDIDEALTTMNGIMTSIGGGPTFSNNDFTYPYTDSFA